MTDWTIGALAAAIRARRISPIEDTQQCLARVERLDGRLRAFITVDAAGAFSVRVTGPLPGNIRTISLVSSTGGRILAAGVTVTT